MGYDASKAASREKADVCATCRYEDQGRLRPVMHRMSLSEIIVPYGDPRAPFNRKCAYDVVDYGMGNCCSSLDLGCDCLGVIKYFDAVLCDKKGASFVDV